MKKGKRSNDSFKKLISAKMRKAKQREENQTASQSNKR
jgi:hypothetical protein